MSMTLAEPASVHGPADLPPSEVGLDRDVFFRTLLRGLAGTLEEVVGVNDAEGLVSVVGGQVGGELNDRYRAALQVDRLTSAQVGQVLVDLKRRIGGAFSVESQDDRRIVLTNRACPFGEKVVGRPSLCMMTSNVFGAIAADNLGYARVDLDETIAQGAPGCRVVVHLAPDEDGTSLGREYFPRENPDAVGP
jgi:predicted ArsR family transcriptional regulator